MRGSRVGAPGLSTFAALACLAALTFSSAATAQTTGRIEGRVVDRAGEALSEARVTAASPKLQGLRGAFTGDDGRFLLLALPPGPYTVVVERDGFHPEEFSNVRIWPDGVKNLEVELTPRHVERVVVTARPPIIDTIRNETGDSWDDETLSRLPLARSPWWGPDAAVDLAPGGSDRGVSWVENRHLIDAIDVTDPYWGGASTSLPPEFLQSTGVKTGAYEPEYGGALGSVMNVVTKSGGNEFHGSVYAFSTGSDLQASTRRPEGFTGQSANYTETEIGFAIGGGIVKDKLWYFVGWSPLVQEDRYTTIQDLDVRQRERTSQYIAKLTWQVRPDHRLVASVFGDPGEWTDGAYSDAAGRIWEDWEYGGRTLSLHYQGRLGPRLWVDATAGRFQQFENYTPISERSPIYHDWTGTADWARQQNCGNPAGLEGRYPMFAVGCVGGSDVWDGGDRIRDVLRASVGWLPARKHELKIGVEYRDVHVDDDRRYPSPFGGALVDDAGVVVDPDGIRGAAFFLEPDSWYMTLRNYDVHGTTDELGVFLQDRWRATPYLTFNLGVRLDSYRATGTATADNPNMSIDFELDEMIAPRLGFVWDISRQGRSKLFGSAARFYEAMPLQTTAIFFGNWDWVSHFFDYPSDGSLPAYTNLGTYLGSSPWYTERWVDPDLKPMHTDEYMLGFEFEAARDLALGTNLVYRELGNLVEDLTLDWGATLFLANPGKTYHTNPVTGQALSEPVTFPEGVREYRAMEITARWEPSSPWEVFGNYVYSRLEGNYHGGFGLHLRGDFEVASLLKYAEGPLPSDRPHQFRAYGSYQFPSGLVTGFSGSYTSGAPISKMARGRFGGGRRFVTPRGSAGRTPDFWKFDLHLQYPFRLGRGVSFSLIADVFNVTNRQATTRVNEMWTYARAEETTDPNECGGTDPDCPGANPYWGTPRRFAAPRAVRLGTKLSW